MLLILRSTSAASGLENMVAIEVVSQKSDNDRKYIL